MTLVLQGFAEILKDHAKGDEHDEQGAQAEKRQREEEDATADAADAAKRQKCEDNQKKSGGNINIKT